MASVILTICGAFSTAVFAQPAPAQINTSEVTSLCNPNKVESSTSDGRTTYTCEGKRPSPRPGASSKYKDSRVRGARADINCNYSESDGNMEWLECTCKADEDSKCTGFIVWCVTQGEEVSGNSGSANCAPGG